MRGFVAETAFVRADFSQGFVTVVTKLFPSVVRSGRAFLIAANVASAWLENREANLEASTLYLDKQLSVASL